MVESAPAYFYLASAEDSSTLYRSPQAVAMLGYTLAEWSDDPDLWKRLLHPEDRDRVLAAFDLAARGGPKFQAEYRLRTRSGAVRWVRDHAALIPDPAGEGMVLQGVVLDITEEVEAKQAAARAHLENEAKSRFLAVMSHELRTPLNSILGFTQLLQLGVGGGLSDRQQRYLEHVRGSGEHLLEVVNDILDLAKIQAGQMEMPLVPVDLADAVADTVEAMEPLAREKELELAQAVAPGLAVLAEPRRLRQALLNLLANAVKFTDQGRIEVVVEPAQEGQVALSVVDTGIGIAATDLDSIFEPFSQVDAGSTRAHEGTGLGLTLTRQFVEAMGGTVSATSEPGAGSRFTISLPAAVER